MTTYYIYKIYCSDNNVTETYVGSTKNISTRKYKHKFHCNNQNSKNHNIKVYQIIRANGGWENFNFVVIEELKECNKIHAHIREEHHRQELKANMNSHTCFSGITDYTSQEERKQKYDKQYREYNKEQINEKQAQPYTCDCGSVLRLSNKSYHFKSKKHQNYLAKLKDLLV